MNVRSKKPAHLVLFTLLFLIAGVSIASADTFSRSVKLSRIQKDASATSSGGQIKTYYIATDEVDSPPKT
jgi:hypothetical protein